jgi:hypothetical protein
MSTSRFSKGTRGSNYRSTSILSCMKVHRGSGPPKLLHKGRRLHFQVNDILETMQSWHSCCELCACTNCKQLAVMGRGEQDWRCAAFGASFSAEA